MYIYICILHYIIHHRIYMYVISNTLFNNYLNTYLWFDRRHIAYTERNVYTMYTFVHYVYICTQCIHVYTMYTFSSANSYV